MTDSAFNPIWQEKIYSQGQALNRYPYDIVVSFVYRHAPRGKPRRDVRILEVGCGSGNNLWFAAREGFSVSGLDGSSSAIEFARNRFREEGLAGDFVVGDFTSLPYADDCYDLVIDRGALTCCGLIDAQKAVREIRRVLKPAGRFFANPYSDHHSSRSSGSTGEDGLTQSITEGSLVGVGGICFYGRGDVDRLLGSGWKVISREHLVIMNEASASMLAHAEWRIVAEKTLAA